MRVALVRGPQVNPFEIQTYVPLAKQGFELVAFASEAPFFEPPAGVEVRKLPSPMDAIQASRGLARKAREALAYRRGTANRLEGLEDALAGFDVLHAAETFNAYTAQAAEAASRHRTPLVVTVWENIPFLPVEPAFRRHRARVLQEADAFVAVTERAKAALLLEGAPAERIHVVPVGIDLARFRPARSHEVRDAHGIPHDALLVLFAARLTWEKGLLDALHGLRLLDHLRPRDGPPVHLLVVGTGDQEAEAKARVRELGLDGRVHFAGGVAYDRMPAHYQAADAFLLGSLPTPRWQEQYGMVLVEAMASGLPVAVAASGSIPEVVGDAAILLQPGDAWSVMEALDRLRDPAARAELAKRGRARAEARFDREKVASRLADLYRSLEGARR